MKTTKSEINPAFVMPARADGAAFWVPSRTQDICYLVERKNGALHCSCPARVAQCCHVRVVEARDAQAAEADRLASLPRVLAEVTTSEAEKLAQIEQSVAQYESGLNRMDYCSDCLHGIHNHKPCAMAICKCGCHHGDISVSEAERQQAERAAKREAALLADHTPERFSIFASER